jgi:ADP-heptose:LPS heptosyltransferase
VVTDHVFGIITKDFSSIIHKVSVLGPRIRNFTARREKGKVLLHNGSGGYGDQIITWPLPSILHEMGYEVHVATEPGNEPLWWTVPHVTSVFSLPIEYEQWRLFEHHAAFETVVNFDEHSGQRHPLDAMLWKIGIDPDSIPYEDKVIPPLLTATEKAEAAKLADGRRYGLYQIAASIPLRSLNAKQSAGLLAELATSLPKLLWIACHDQHVPEDHLKEVSELGLPNVKAMSFPTPRAFLAAAAGASLCVGVDSFLIHVAGCAGVPAIGLWGPTSPSLRRTYYERHSAIFERGVCPHAPCLGVCATLPSYCPSKTGVCSVLEADIKKVVEIARHCA